MGRKSNYISRWNLPSHKCLRNLGNSLKISCAEILFMIWTTWAGAYFGGI